MLRRCISKSQSVYIHAWEGVYPYQAGGIYMSRRRYINNEEGPLSYIVETLPYPGWI